MRWLCLLLGHRRGDGLYGYTRLPQGYQLRRPRDFELMEQIGFHCPRCGRNVIQRGRMRVK